MMIFKIAMSFSLVLFGALCFAAEVYKYTDENGNIHYSDQPKKNIEEDRLKKLTLKKSDDLNPKSNWQTTAEIKPPSKFEDFAIASPKNDSVFAIEDGNMMVLANLSKNLPTQYRIKFYLNGIARGKVKSASQLISDVKEGSHTLYAEVIVAKSREVIKTTKEVSFTVKNTP